MSIVLGAKRVVNRAIINVTDTVTDALIQLICDTAKMTMCAIFNLNSSQSSSSCVLYPSSSSSSLTFQSKDITIKDLIQRLHVGFKLPLIKDVLSYPSSFYVQEGSLCFVFFVFVDICFR